MAQGEQKTLFLKSFRSIIGKEVILLIPNMLLAIKGARKGRQYYVTQTTGNT